MFGPPYNNSFGDGYEDTYMNNGDYIDLGWQQNNPMGASYSYPHYYQESQYDDDPEYLDYDEEQEQEAGAEVEPEPVTTEMIHSGSRSREDTAHPHLQSSRAPSISAHDGSVSPLK